MENKNIEKFEFTYSGRQQDEIKKIRAKYTVSEEESKLHQHPRLDAGVTSKGTAVSLAIGILSALILGVGMCCCMVWGGPLFIPGILIGLLGILGVALAYPLYNRITKKERERIAPEILRLTDELLK